MFRRIKFYKCVFFEIIETLCTICLVVAETRNPPTKYRNHLLSHFETLKGYSEELRREIYKEK